MISRVSLKVFKLYRELSINRTLPAHVTYLIKALYDLDAILDEYEACGEVFCREYGLARRQWKIVEDAFYKALKNIPQ